MSKTFAQEAARTPSAASPSPATAAPVQTGAPAPQGRPEFDPIDLIERSAHGHHLARLRVSGPAQAARAAASRDRTGLPPDLKAGVERLSGLSLDDVRVRYDSPGPARLRALAYTRGTEIDLAPGQERHLPHETWHVVQQLQGRVPATIQAKGLDINADPALEHEADRMGQRALAQAPGAAPSLLRRAPRPPGRTAQMAWGTQTYTVDGSQRTLHVEPRGTLWGGTAASGQHAGHADTTNRPRAILYETISTMNGIDGLTGRLNALAATALWDVGLTVVLNRAYTPATTFDSGGQPTTTARTKGDAVATVRSALDTKWGQIQGAWNGPPLQVATAAWERREKEKDDRSTELEVVQGSVPYSTLRKVAATNQGAKDIDGELRTNHDQIWRKMGDDDMPIANPNDATHKEMQKLTEVENAGQIYQQNTFVTFGYNLTTTGTPPVIADILKGLYTKEMELRDQIAATGAPMYPSEPTSYYRAVTATSMDAPWAKMEGKKVGGSGQQLEGAKLAQAMGGYHHATFHSVMADTSAGHRNDGLVALLSGWWNGGNGDPWQVKEDLVEAEINKLDQSALKQDEYLGKVPANLGVDLTETQHGQIEALVTQYRAAAAKEACKTLRQALGRNLFLRNWTADAERKQGKLGASLLKE